MMRCVTLTLCSREVAAAVARLRAAAAHARVRLHLALPPRRDDPALQRRMRYRDETVGTADVCQQAFRTMCVLRKHVAPGLERARATNQAALLLRVSQAFNAFCAVTSTLIRWGLAVSAFGSVIVSTPRL